MKRHTLTLVAVCSTLLAMAAWGQDRPAPDTNDETEKERQAFQGSWRAVSVQRADGRQATQDEVQNTRLIVQGNKFTLTGKDSFRISGTFVIDPSKSPKTIDVLLPSKEGRGIRFLGIYQAQGGKRQSCFALPGKERPTQFAPEKGYFGFTWSRDPIMDLIVDGGKLVSRNPAQALKVFEKAAALEPDNERVVLGQYISLMHLKRQQDGATLLNKWVQAKPADPRRWLCKGMAEAQTGLPEKALVSFDKLIELQPQEGANWVGKGQVLSMLKRDQEALKAFDKAITLTPKHPAAWHDRGGVLLRCGQYDKAIKSLERALELRPRFAESWYDRACAYSLKGDKAKAIADLRKALELKPALKAHAARDPDFRGLRKDLDFKKLINPKSKKLGS